jgi:nitroreductase / dihydropteridine reductase
MNNIIDALNWRYATKKFDVSRPVADADIDEIIEALRLTASSFGMQAYRIAVIKNKALQEELRSVSWQQAQISDASHIIHFLAFDKVEEKHIERLVSLHRSVRRTAEDKIERFKAYLAGFINSKTVEEQRQWSSKQTYIAMGNLLTVLAIKKIDSCPIEGIEPEEWDRILKLEGSGLKSVACVAIGYRDAGDELQHAAKIRLPKSELFVHFR